MKKLIIISILTIALLLTACSSNEVDAGSGNTKIPDVTPQAMYIDGVEVTRVYYSKEHLDRDYFYRLKELMPHTDLAVIGELTGQSELIDGKAYNQLLVTQVLEGDVKVGEILKVVHQHDFDKEEGALLARDGLTPMHKGDRWIYFLEYSNFFEAYISVGLFEGRYPLPNEQLMQIAELVTSTGNELDEWLSSKTLLVAGDKMRENDGWCYASDKKGNWYRFSYEEAEQIADIWKPFYPLADKLPTSCLGVLNFKDFQFGIYAEILEHYQIEAQDWVNPGRGFDARLVELYEEMLKEVEHMLSGGNAG